MIDDGMSLVQETLRHQIAMSQQSVGNPPCCVKPLVENLTFNLLLALRSVGLKS